MRYSRRGVIGCTWTEQATGAWPVWAGSETQNKGGVLPPAANAAWQTHIRAAELSGIPQGKLEIRVAPGRGLCFIPSALMLISVHLVDY